MNAQENGWEQAKTEYQCANANYNHFSDIRRQDMAFATTVQAAVLTIVNSHLLDLNTPKFLLTLIAFLVLVIGINSERRVSAYMAGYMVRAKQIEDSYSMALLHEGTRAVQGTKLLLPNRRTFLLYYTAFIAAWLVIWLLNVSLMLRH